MRAKNEKIKKKSSKIEWVYRARGFGILLVVAGHVLRGLNNANLFSGSAFTNIDYVLYTFHMPLFFFLSGIFFLRSLKKRGLKSFLLNKVNLLLYLYIIWSIIQLIVQVLLNKYINGHADFKDFMQILYLPKGQMWFLYVLLLIFIINAFIFSKVSEGYKFLILTISIIVGIYLRVITIEDYYVIDKLSANFLFFQLGIMWSTLSFKSSLNSVNYFLAVIAMALVFTAVTYFNINNNRLDYDNQIIAAIVGILLISLISQVIKLKTLYGLGKFSLQIYLAHILFASGARIFLHKFLNVTDIYLHILAGITFGVFGPLVLVRISEKYKIFKFLFENKIKKLNVTD